MTGEMTPEEDQSMTKMINVRDDGLIGRDVTKINHNTNTIHTHISSKANITQARSETAVRPPTRTRVTKLARWRN